LAYSQLSPRDLVAVIYAAQIFAANQDAFKGARGDVFQAPTSCKKPFLARSLSVRQFAATLRMHMASNEGSG
jgi:hypothetical protein